MSNPTPEQLDLTQPIDRVVKQVVDLATAEREAKAWWQAILRLVPKEHHAPADVIRYLEERLNAWGGLLVTADFEQSDGVSAAQRITDEVRAYARLRGGLALRLAAPRNAADAVLLERLNDLASLAHGVESLRELNAGLKAQLEEARPKAAMWDALKRALDDVPDNDVVPQVAETRKALCDIGDALGFSRMERPYRVADETVQRLRVARAKQDLLDGWAQVACLLCGDACDLSDVSGVVAAAQKQRDEVDALRACVHPAAWARLEKALGAPKTITQIVEQVEHLVESRDAEKAQHADELTKAQTLVDQWDMQYQDLRDKVADFHTQISRALGVEPLSLTADEMLRRISEGAAATSLRDRLIPLLFSDAISARNDALVSRVEKALAAAGLLRELDEALQAHAPNHAAQAAVAGASTVGLLLEKLRSGKIRENGAQHVRLVEALHVGRSAESVTPDELIEWAKQTYTHRTIGERLFAALRAQLPRFAARDCFQALVELTVNVESGHVRQALWAHDAWGALVSAINKHRIGAKLDFESAHTVETLRAAVVMSARLREWMAAQQEEAQG